MDYRSRMRLDIDHRSAMRLDAFDFARSPLVGGSPAPAYSPANVADVEFYCEIQNLGLADDDPIVQLTDESPNGNDAIQGTEGERGIHKTGIVNGLAVARLDGIDNHYDLVTANSGGGFTLSCVAQGEGMILGGDVGAFGGRYFYLKASVQVYDGVTFTGLVTNSDPTAAFHLWTAVYDGTNIKIYEDGVQVHSEGSTGGSWGNVLIGLSGTTYFGGDVAMVMVASRDFDSEELEAFHAYELAKFLP